MNLILCLETSTKTCSVALGAGNKILGQKEITSDKYTHSENLMPFVKDVMEGAGKTMNDLKAVAVSKGPGSYTGLRIGTSSAKGICYALGIPLISINSLEVLARSFMANCPEQLNNNSLLCPMIDARRMEVYTSVYNLDCQEIDETEALIIDSNSFAQRSKGDIHFFGDGAAKCEGLLDKSNFHFHHSKYPKASAMMEKASLLFEQKSFEDLAYFEPFYLKDFIATAPKKLI